MSPGRHDGDLVAAPCLDALVERAQRPRGAGGDPGGLDQHAGGKRHRIWAFVNGRDWTGLIKGWFTVPWSRRGAIVTSFVGSSEVTTARHNKITAKPR